MLPLLLPLLLLLAAGSGAASPPAPSPTPLLQKLDDAAHDAETPTPSPGLARSDLLLLGGATAGVAAGSSVVGFFSFLFTIEGPLDPVFRWLFFLPLVATPLTAGFIAANLDGGSWGVGIAAGLASVVGLTVGAVVGYQLTMGLAFDDNRTRIFSALTGAAVVAGLGAGLTAVAGASAVEQAVTDLEGQSHRRARQPAAAAAE